MIEVRVQDNQILKFRKVYDWHIGNNQPNESNIT